MTVLEAIEQLTAERKEKRIEPLNIVFRSIYDKLNEWMFDYRGLISAGLAIDVNTLPENPYEL